MTSVALAGATPLTARLLQAESKEAGGRLIAYVGTFSSPLRDVLPTQVDLPPGNGRGIHRFLVDRETGAMRPIGVCEMGTSPSCLVVDAAGRGVPGIPVTLLPPPIPEMGGARPLRPSADVARTGEDGRYEIREIPPAPEAMLGEPYQADEAAGDDPAEE